MILEWALRVAPPKARPAVCVLCAKVCEFNGDAESARGILCQAVADYWAEWRVFLEFAQFFLHQCDVD